MSLFRARSPTVLQASAPIPVRTTKDELVSLLPKYDISVEAVLKHPQLSEGFHAYLKKTYNEGPLLFIHQVDKYVTLETEQRRDCAGKIIAEFVETNAPCEINIGHEVKSLVITNFESQTDESSAITLFAEMRQSVLSDLAVDSLIGFVNSEQCKDILVPLFEKDRNFLDNIGTFRIERKQSTTLEGLDMVAGSPKAPSINVQEPPASPQNVVTTSSPELVVTPTGSTDYVTPPPSPKKKPSRPSTPTKHPDYDEDQPAPKSPSLSTLFGGLVRLFSSRPKSSDVVFD